eukprot:SAG22_NODE_606_length_8615_cov_6.190348_2_plen_147_part_00
MSTRCPAPCTLTTRPCGSFRRALRLDHTPHHPPYGRPSLRLRTSVFSLPSGSRRCLPRFRVRRCYCRCLAAPLHAGSLFRCGVGTQISRVLRINPGMQFVDKDGAMLLDWPRPQVITPNGWNASCETAGRVISALFCLRRKPARPV